MNTARSRLACASCTRRKVKCSKTTPCTNCIRRGEQDLCSTESDAFAAPATSAVESGPVSSASPTASRDLQELAFLRRRVVELENGGSHDVKPSPASLLPPLLPPIVSPPSTTDPRHTPIKEDPSARTVLENRAPSRDAVVEDAASILEFLAWGRRKNPDYQTVATPQHGPRASLQVGDAPARPDAADADTATNFDDLTQTSVLQLLLPPERRTWDLVLWHERSLLWYHCSYYAPTLRQQLDAFYNKYGGSIEHPEVNLQWVAFLFSVLTGSITCLPTHTAEQWGFGHVERATLSKRWFQAVISCLNKADYAANHSILGVQAIATLTISAHMLGFSNTQSIHLAAAVKISQSLGLHRLTADVPGSPEDKEAGRRVWAQLCCQDWWSIPFSETYLVNPLYSKSDLPMNCHDNEVVPLPDDVPTVSSFSRFMVGFASVMPPLQDGLMSCNTLFTKYEHVMRWDKQLKTHATAGRPIYLSQIPIDPKWPEFVPWARRALAISSSHKIIMVHRTFLTESFVNPAFAATRRTCLSAAKTIINEYKYVVEEDGPVMWIHQAFAVAASIILTLDVLHREAREPEVREHVRLVETTLEILRRCQNSMIALRGVKLLSALLDEVSASSMNNRKRRLDDDDHASPRGHKRLRIFNVPDFVKTYCGDPDKSAPVPVQTPAANAGPVQSVPADLFFDAGALEGASFENLLYLANQDFYSF